MKSGAQLFRLGAQLIKLWTQNDIQYLEMSRAGSPKMGLLKTLYHYICPCRVSKVIVKTHDEDKGPRYGTMLRKVTQPWDSRMVGFQIPLLFV